MIATARSRLHEGRFAIRRDYRGDRYFVRADGRAIPRCGYRADDYTDDDVGEYPSMEGAPHADGDRENPSMEVREPRGVYRLALGHAGVSSRAKAVVP
ncbi:MAG TPA: hypothetical protein VFL30_13130 [Rhodanobacteraceae bacterium]|nr:hypothetical protein [Rhodanobacteraceae bacterium]